MSGVSMTCVSYSSHGNLLERMHDETWAALDNLCWENIPAFHCQPRKRPAHAANAFVLVFGTLEFFPAGPNFGCVQNVSQTHLLIPPVQEVEMGDAPPLARESPSKGFNVNLKSGRKLELP